MNSAEKWASKPDQGNDWMRMLGAPPIPASQSHQNTRRQKGTGPYHSKSRSEVAGFDSPVKQKLFENKDIAENKKRDHEL